MKKLLLTTVLAIVCVTTPAFSFTSCEGGTIVTRNKYTDANAPAGCTETTCPATTKTFCKSNGTMNWWSALTWCDAQGGNLATFTSMCPGIAPANKNVEGACPALQGVVGTSQWAWSGYPVAPNGALCVDLLSGAMLNHARNNTTAPHSVYAFCE